MKKTLSFVLTTMLLSSSSLVPVFAQTNSTTTIEDKQTEKEPLANIEFRFRTSSGQITGNGVRLRATPSLNGRILTTLNKGDYVTCYMNEDSTGWEQVEADGYVWQCVGYGTINGWVAVKYIQNSDF